MNLLTFDIEEWFHCDFITNERSWSNHEIRIHKNTDYILNTLSKFNRKGTFFILGWVAKKYPEIVKKIKYNGHEIGCHSMNHKLVHSFNPDQFLKDTQQALNITEQIIGEKIIIYRAPAFSITKKSLWAFDILNSLGITHDASIFPAYHDYGGFPEFNIHEPSIVQTNDFQIKEFPVNVIKILNKPIVFSGGGFFRFFPYFFIKNWTINSKYTMTYFHPRDFDPDQPILNHLPIIRKFKSYYGLKGSKNKFEKFLSEFQTESVLQYSKKFDWDKSKKYSY